MSNTAAPGDRVKYEAGHYKIRQLEGCAAQSRSDELSQSICFTARKLTWQGNTQVCLYGVSYDGTIALFTTAEQHPAVKAAAPQCE